MRLATLLILVGCAGETPDDDSLPPASPGCWWAYTDADGDGYGDADGATELCEGDAGAGGYVSDDADCDDGDAAVSPGAAERCNGADDNCDGTADEEPLADASAWYADADADGYGDPHAVTVDCDAPANTVTEASDCDDADAAASPGLPEVCGDHDDDNCDGRADEGQGYAYWAEVADQSLADGETAVWSVLGCDPETGGGGCPLITFTRSGGGASVTTTGGSDVFAAGGELPADVAWEGPLPLVTLDGPVGGTVTWTFTPASSFGEAGLRVVVGVSGTGGVGEGPVTLVADQDLVALGTYAPSGGATPSFTWPDTVTGSSDSATEDALLLFALDPDASSVSFTVTDGGTTPDLHGYTLGYVVFAPCEG